MNAPVLLALVILLSVVIYALSAGADFGAGVWDLLCSGPRRQVQRSVIEEAIEPIWESNHVWLILILVLLFTGFPSAFATGATLLTIPLFLVLLGIVLRGASFVFRAYFTGNMRLQLYWGTVFSVASSFTPIFLGVLVGTISTDSFVTSPQHAVETMFWSWASPFPLSVGALTLALFSYLAACYLCVEATHTEVRRDFRGRALASGGMSVACAVLTFVLAANSASSLRAKLVSSPLAWVAEGGAFVLFLVTTTLLRREHYRLARIGAAAQVSLIVMGWGICQYPNVIAPGITIFNSAAPYLVVRDLLCAVGLGALVLIPSLALLYTVFKKTPKPTMDDIETFPPALPPKRPLEPERSAQTSRPVSSMFQTAAAHMPDSPMPSVRGIEKDMNNSAELTEQRHALNALATTTVSIDGERVNAAPGELVLDAVLRHMEIPHICYHSPLMGSIQTCDTCLVEVNGVLVRACGTKIAGGEDILVSSERASAARAEGFDVILGNHMLYCTVCDNNNENCRVHNTALELQVKHQKHPFKPKPYEVDMSNPFYRYDPSQCILCGQCVQACQTVEVNETLSIGWELEHPRVLWDGGMQIAGSSCVSCGHCVTVCPCNALMEKSMLGEAGFLSGIQKGALDKMIDVVKAVEPEMGYGAIMQVSQIEASMREERIKKTKTVCTYCGVGCSYDVWTKDREILKIVPLHGDANQISTCVKGKFGWDFVNHKDRLQKPLIRQGDDFREADWEEALSLIASELGTIKQKHGPDAIGVIVSSKTTNEDGYLLQKFARSVIGTNNVDNCSRYCQAPATKGLMRTVGYAGDSGSIHDIGGSALVVIVGANTAESHPVLATRIKRAKKLHGQRLIVADPRTNEMAERSDIHLRPTPGTDLVWLCAMSRYMFDHGHARTSFLEQWVNDVDAYRTSLEKFTMEYAAETCGIALNTLNQVAEEMARAETMCILWAMGVTQHTSASDTSTAISNLLLVTGNYMKPNCGAYPLRGHNNVQGAGDIGAMPDLLPGYQDIKDPGVRALYEKVWKTPLPPTDGMNNHRMVEAVYAGKLKALFVAGEDMISADSNSNFVGGAFEKLDLFVVQDIFFSETCRYADVVLPAAPALEKDGTFVNTERRIQRLYQALPELGDSKADWKITQELANRMGANWGYEHPSQIMAELASVSPIFEGVTYDRLDGYNTLQWPVAADGTDQPLLYMDGFTFPDRKARLFPVEYHEPTEAPDQEYDLFLNTGRLLEHFHEGNLTYRVAGIVSETPETFVEISPELAAERNISSGQWVRLVSRHGAFKVKALITDRVAGKQVYLPLLSREEPVNVLTSSLVDRVTETPAYKEAAVRMEVLPEKGSSPLKSTNFRAGSKRTPQSGVEVERKWKRKDYRMPGTAPLVQIASITNERS